METTLNTDITQHKPSSPKRKRQDKPRQRIQSRYKQKTKLCTKHQNQATDNILEKMKFEEILQISRNKSYKTENAPKPKTKPWIKWNLKKTKHNTMELSRHKTKLWGNKMHND